ncbi:phosphate signaling complex protein PhoU [Cytophagaceae bacterium ABcell3]|nr:phosphate signaling complex protein PhoU [Cytophagaceae bacterium ABcell3]
MNLLETEIGELKTELLDMIALVKGQFEKAIVALSTFDKDLAKEVLVSEKKVNESELKIDSKGEHILALFSPVAIDLRFVMASLKMVSDIERIGDNAKAIAHYVLLSENPFDKQLQNHLQLEKISKTGLEMLSILHESFETDNTRLAKSIFVKDETIDKVNMAANGSIAEYLQHEKDKSKILEALYLLSIVRKIERVGDCAANISEEIIFYVKAKVLKHQRKNL